MAAAQVEDALARLRVEQAHQVLAQLGDESQPAVVQPGVPGLRPFLGDGALPFLCGFILKIRGTHMSEPAEGRDRLSEQIHLLGDVLGETIVEQEGRPLFELVEEVRGLAKAHRAGDVAAGERLSRRIQDLPLEEARVVLKAFASYFQLVNLAEDQERVHVLRSRARESAARKVPLAETVAAAVQGLRDQGLTAAEMQDLVRRLSIMPVFTAHPTEAKRRTVLTKLARVGDTLEALDAGPPEPDEKEAAVETLREDVVALWQTDEGRSHRPSVLDEVRNGLYYFERTLFDLAPTLGGSVRRALTRYYPGRRSSCRSSCASAAGSEATATATRSSPRPPPRRRCASTRCWCCASTSGRSSGCTAS